MNRQLVILIAGLDAFLMALVAGLWFNEIRGLPLYVAIGALVVTAPLIVLATRGQTRDEA